MAISLTPLPLPASADPSKFATFGREVTGVHPGILTDEEFRAIEEALYKVGKVRDELCVYFCSFIPQHSVLLFRDITLTPEQQYSLTKVCPKHP